MHRTDGDTPGCRLHGGHGGGGFKKKGGGGEGVCPPAPHTARKWRKTELTGFGRADGANAPGKGDAASSTGRP